jgi:hypothetical protein|tara:strand:- start:13717 stop:13887 length:171 start_codon:yes stop_codon:yes gene_type:complete
MNKAKSKRALPEHGKYTLRKGGERLGKVRNTQGDVSFRLRGLTSLTPLCVKFLSKH